MSQHQLKVDDMRLCYQKIPSIAREDQIPPSNLIVPQHDLSGPFELAIGKDKFWKVGKVLKVSWWAREEKPVSGGLKRKVEDVAKQWDAICNIGLDFGDYGDDAEVRIAFTPDKGSWSFVGKDCLLPPSQGGPEKGDPTMNFGWLNELSRDDEIQSVVLHEFGHALGCIHEHQNPAGGIKWNEQLVLREFSGPPNNWDESMIRHNILNPVATSMNSVFDPDSIMLYFFDARLTLDGRGTHQNTKLSQMDKTYIKRLYPPQGRDVGFFDTKELPQLVAVGAASQVSNPGLFNTKKVMFDPAYDSVPKMAIGLSRIDMSCRAYKSVAASVDHLANDHAIVSVDTWDTSILNGGAATWIEAMDTNTDWQFGEFNTQELRDRNDTTSQVAGKVIYFEKPYENPPKVVVALKLIDLDNLRDYRVKTYVTDIFKDRFTIHIDTWGDSILYAGAASWIAYPTDLEHTLSISVSTKEDQAKNAERFNFPSGAFVKKPEVRTFLNLIDTQCGADLRLKASVDQITQDGLTWHADTWDDTHLRQAGVSIIVYA